MLSKRYRFALLVVMLFGFAAVPGALAQQKTVAATPPSAASMASLNCTLGSASADLDVNNVRARLYNVGTLFWKGSGAVYTVPKDGEANAIFASGLWIGGLVNGERRFAGTMYGPFEFWPGPLDDDGNPPDDCTPFDRIYVVSQVDLSNYERRGELTDDLRDWPWELGAPVRDGDGNPDNYDLAAGDRPEIIGEQAAWWVMNDAGNAKEWSQTPAMNLEVQVLAYSFDHDPVIENTTLYRYTIINKGDAPIEETYLGFFVDADVGNAGDDYVGSDPARNMGFTYNGLDIDQGFDGYGATPPAIGYVIVQGPVGDPDGLDNDGDGERDEAGERLGMTSFLSHFNNSSVQGNPRGNSEEPYFYLQGRWRDGASMTVGGTGYGGVQTTKFMFSGDPPGFWSQEDLDDRGTSSLPRDQRFLISTGPFTLEPGEAEEIVHAIVWSQATNRLTSVDRLKLDVDFLRLYLAGEDVSYVLPPAPTQAPALVSPPEEAEQVATEAYFTWMPVQDVQQYRLQVATDAAFGETIFDGVAKSQTAMTVSLQNEALYFWRVRAENISGEGPWSEARLFNTGRSANPDPSYTNFLTVSNADGPIVPATGAAADFQGFPVPERPGESQQRGSGIWFIATGDNGNRGSFEAFSSRSTSGSFFSRKIVPYDFEIRFTDEGGLAHDPFCAFSVFPVPFELWRTGIGTPDDPSDDVRLVPYVIDNDLTSIVATTGLPAFNLNSTASIQAAMDAATGSNAPCASPSADHSLSSALNDPFTDWIYFTTPDDETPGDAGYRAWEAAAMTWVQGESHYNELTTDDAIRRVVFVNWNGGDVDAGDYNQALPELGTVFRIETSKPLDLTFETTLDGVNNVPPTASGATGSATLGGPPDVLRVEASFEGLSADFVAAYLSPGDVDEAFRSDSLTLVVQLGDDGRSGTIRPEDNPLNGIELPADFDPRNANIVIATTAFPQGELRGRLLPQGNRAPEAPTGLTPGDGATFEVSGSPGKILTTAWNAVADPNANPVAYVWQLATDPGFENIVLNRSAGLDTETDIMVLDLAIAMEAEGVAAGSTVTWYHRVVATDGSLATEGDGQSILLRRGVITSTDDPHDLPARFALGGNYPNPFNPTTTLLMDLPQAASVTVEVFDVLGRRVLELGPQALSAGAARQFRVDGRSLSSGLYLYRVTARAAGAATSQWTSTGRFILVK